MTLRIDEDHLIWEEHPCDWCGSIENEFLFEGPDRVEHLPGTFRMVRCQKCGILRQNPRLAWESLKNYYTENYDSHAKLIRHEKGFLRRLDRRYGPWKRLKAIERFVQGGKLLDVGCGTGLFLEEALRSERWDVIGIEPNERAASYVRNTLNIDVRQDMLTNLSFPPQTFDVVTMWNVLEHIDNPFSTLRYTHQIIKDQGLLVISIPNLEGWEAGVFGKNWMGWELPRHLYIFPRKNLRLILENIGFRWIDQRCISTSYSVCGHTLDFWSQSWNAKASRFRPLMLNLYRSWLGRILMIPPLWISDRLRLSTIITIILKKI
jgi:2-polyprenyl-3-methyl-5-hydroxy-6-metoxy-1,4-benzoquinol methylase